MAATRTSSVAADTLLVPVEVKALVVNDQARKGQNFQRWQYNYHNLDSFTSPEPAPFSSNANDFGLDPNNNGVYLHWTLPTALRHGSQSAATGQADYPLVPNRWLVVRYSGPPTARVATAWLVESDFVDPNQGTAPFLDPTVLTGYQVTNIGRQLPAADWQETNTKPLFLTAVGPGNLSFATYQPYVPNVFSLHDSLGDVADTDTLSYLVTGWYSDPTADILSHWEGKQPFADYLQQLEWAVTGEPTATAHLSVYHGLVNGLQWDKNGPIPASDRPTDPSKVKVAVGNTSIDALTALVKAQVVADGPALLDPQLLEAFQYDLIRVLDEPDGQARLQDHIHRAWFGTWQGGYAWEVVDNPANANGTPAPTAAELQTEAQWLSTLNQQQAAFDEAVRTVATRQWELYAVWWKQGRANYLQTINNYPSELTPADFAAALNPANAAGLLAQVKAQLDALNQLIASNAVPFGTDQPQLAASIQTYATARQLPPTRVLRQSARPVYFQANDPVVLLTGTRVDDILVANHALNCRFPYQTVTGFTFETATIDAAALTGLGKPALGAVPGIVSNLLVEFLLLDPTNAPSVAQTALHTSAPATITALAAAMQLPTAVQGLVPAVDRQPWQQPWAPLFLMWEVQYYPIAYRDQNNKPTWQFTGTEYDWGGTGAATTALPLNGRIFLTPQCSFNFKSRLDQWLQTDPDADVQQLEDFISATDKWDFLSQTLDGFTQQLIMHDPQGNLSPDSSTVLYPKPSALTLADLVGGQATYAPAPGPAQPVPFQGWPPSGFQQWRAGQFYFSRLMVVDRFGQSIEVANTTSQLYLEPIKAEDLLPVHTVLPQEPQRFVQLPPRILQPGRLNLDFVSAAYDKQLIDLHADVNPVCAWVLLNYLDQALACYDATGQALGEVWVALDARQQRQVQWRPAPFSTYLTVADLLADPNLRHLGQMVSGLQTAGPDAFTDLLNVIDSALWTINPTGDGNDQNLGLLVGRPLALTRARVQFELRGTPVSDQSWRYTFQPLAPDFVNYFFPVALGREAQTQDGLIGYFTGEDYAHLNCVPQPTGPAATSGYVQWIGGDAGNYLNLQFNPSSAAYITVLADPRAAVHATTVVVPVAELRLPARFVTPALSSMQVSFRVGPLLSETQTTVGTTTDPGVTCVLLPQPSEKHGTWAWLQRSTADQQWTSYGVLNTDERARFPNTPARLREGVLALATALAPTETK